jgi:hypothetical protein
MSNLSIGSRPQHPARAVNPPNGDNGGMIGTQPPPGRPYFSLPTYSNSAEKLE